MLGGPPSAPQSLRQRACHLRTLPWLPRSELEHLAHEKVVRTPVDTSGVGQNGPEPCEQQLARVRRNDLISLGQPGIVYPPDGAGASAREELAGALNEGWWYLGVCGGSVGVQTAHLDGAPARTEEAHKDEEREYAHRAIGPPNGPHLSCGRNARGRKAAERQTKGWSARQTQFLPTCERPPASSAC